MNNPFSCDVEFSDAGSPIGVRIEIDDGDLRFYGSHPKGRYYAVFQTKEAAMLANQIDAAINKIAHLAKAHEKIHAERIENLKAELAALEKST